eukprot:401398_1
MASSLKCIMRSAHIHNIVLVFALLIRLKCIGGCTATERRLNAAEDCTETNHLIPLYSNTSIAQRLDLCSIVDDEELDSFRIQFVVDSGEQLSMAQIAGIIGDFTYSFYLYDYSEWISGNCDDNLYNIESECGLSPIISYTDMTLDISGFGADNMPHLVVNFDTCLIIDSSFAYTSLIWILTVNTGFAANDNANVKFITCNVSQSKTDKIEYTVYPLKYNDKTHHNTAVMYHLSSLCSTHNDNRLQGLNPYKACAYDPSVDRRSSSWDQQVSGLRFAQNNEKYFQYFAVAQSTELSGIAIYFEKPPTGGPGGGGSSTDCAFTAELSLYSSDDTLLAQSIREVNGLSTAATAIPFLFDDAIAIDMTQSIRYFYFGVSVTDGVTSGCDIALMLCYDQSNMMTFYYGADGVECLDYYTGPGPGGGGSVLSNVDIPFDLITSSETTESPETSSETTPNPSQNPGVDTTLVYYTTVEDEEEETTANEDDNAGKQSVIEFEESVALFVAIGILAGIGIVLLVGAMITARVTKADNFVYSAVAVFVVHSIDVFSDVLFCISIWTDHALVADEANNQSFLLLAICSLIFIVAPMCKNFYDLIQFQRETQDDPLHGDRYRAWLNSFGTTLLLFALISGSTFGTMKLMNSNLLGLRMFSMGLCISHLRDYHSYRMVNVVLMENLPQLIIQIAFTSVLTEAVPPISILAAVTSILSIIVAVVDHFSKKELSKQAVPSELFTFQITSNEISSKPSKYRNRQRKVIKGISKILVIDPAAIEILTIDEYSDEMGDGLVVHFLITTLKKKGYEMHQMLKDSIVNGSMARNMSKAWQLHPNDAPSITHLRLLQIESEDAMDGENVEGGNTNQTTTTSTDASQTQLLQKKVTAALPQFMQNFSGSSPRPNGKKKIVVKASDSMQFNSKLYLNGDTPSGKDDAIVIISPIREVDDDCLPQMTDNKQVIDTDDGDKPDDDDEVVEIEMQDVKS